MSASEAIFPR